MTYVFFINLADLSKDQQHNMININLPQFEFTKTDYDHSWELSAVSNLRILQYSYNHGPDFIRINMYLFLIN